ncbi:MAG: YbjN domain-containing protein [Myxococcota bacterium]
MSDGDETSPGRVSKAGFADARTVGSAPGSIASAPVTDGSSSFSASEPLSEPGQGALLERRSRVWEDQSSNREYIDAATMVNDYLRRLGSELAVSFEPLDEDGYTEVLRGSAQVGVNVLEEHDILLLLSRIMDVPKEGREDFYRRLLELNFLVTSDAAFAIDKDRDAVYLRAHRRLGGLDYEEFADLLAKVTSIADEWDDRLNELFPTEG